MSHVVGEYWRTFHNLVLAKFLVLLVRGLCEQFPSSRWHVSVRSVYDIYSVFLFQYCAGFCAFFRVRIYKPTVAAQAGV
eukprot:2793025-Amphidinium_carterae.1